MKICLVKLQQKTTENQFIYHSITWLCYWAVILWVLSNKHNPYLAFKLSASIISVQALVFYLNLNFLLPKLLEKKRFWSYFTAVISVIGTSYFFYTGLHFLLDIQSSTITKPNIDTEEQLHRMHTGMTIVSSLSILFISTIYKSMRDSRKQENQQIELKNKQLESEMKFLKSQINPHFLFNALNNIYTLSELQSSKTSSIVLKLSEMMRYMLYESNTDYVSIEKELHYIENYITMHQLKEDEKMKIVFDHSKADTARQIAPLLLLPFFENSFKHGNLENLDEGKLNAYLETTEDTIFFSIENTKPKSKYTKDDVGGVGLVNVKRRLELMYPKRHDLKITSEANLFKIELTIYNKIKKNVQGSYCRRRAAS